MASSPTLDTTTYNAQLEDLNSRLDAMNATLDTKLDELYKKRGAAEDASQSQSYTLFASGLNHGGRDVELKNKNTSTDLAIIFDVVENHSYTRNVDKTQYAAENKVTYSDHAVIEDGKFSFSARVNSSPVYLIQNNFIDKDTDPNNPVQSKRPQKALEALLEIIEKRQLVTLVTEDIILENYICTSMQADRGGESGAALVFQLEFTEFRTFSLGKTVLATNFSDPKKSDTKQKGAVGSSATDKQIDVMSSRTKFVGDSDNLFQGAADKWGLDTKELQKTGTYSPATGKFTDIDGNDMKF